MHWRGGEKEKEGIRCFFRTINTSQANGTAYVFAQRPALHTFEGDQSFATSKLVFRDTDF